MNKTIIQRIQTELPYMSFYDGAFKISNQQIHCLLLREVFELESVETRTMRIKLAASNNILFTRFFQIAWCSLMTGIEFFLSMQPIHFLINKLSRYTKVFARILHK